MTDTIAKANAGDSRGVLGIKGRAKPLSQDHKPQLESESPNLSFYVLLIMVPG
jgi:protein phosphatase 2C family protein 2/3